MSITETALKHRGGRPKRADVDRYDNGRIREDPRKLAAWNRARDVFEAVGLNPLMATQRGRLYFMKELTTAQFEAANLYAELCERYDRLVLCRRRSAPSPSFERTGRGEGGQDDAEAVAAIRGQFDAAHTALLAGGKLVEAAVNRLCRDESSGAMLGEAKRGLDLLTVHFGMVKVPR